MVFAGVGDEVHQFQCSWTEADVEGSTPLEPGV